MALPLPTSLHFAQVDAFASAPFSGNPAAVVLLDRPRSATWMQRCAQEFNLAETAFVFPVKEKEPVAWSPSLFHTYASASASTRGSGEAEEAGKVTSFSDFSLRWFTPATEVDLCGHATLASAHTLFSAGLATTPSVRFHTRSGVLTANQSEGTSSVEINLPSNPPVVAVPSSEWGDLAAALGGLPLADIVWAGKTADGSSLLIELTSEGAVRSLVPSREAIEALGAPLVMASARGAGKAAEGEPPATDFVSRVFAPAFGIDEDPVTGAAHCVLTPYWTAKLGKNPLSAFQASARGGRLEVEENNERGRTILRGTCITMMSGLLSPSACEDVPTM
eukprot:TRINITY_DN17177_c0_g1_i1.p1 TRINITY_DN17177_c0_g1~~TRINITY_DN17177_c0_g1_i1.p1  ORF type:complete len:335 (-),score=59.15 TRINITY_DN17177_c0_g1_i1:233-1237(-)